MDKNTQKVLIYGVVGIAGTLTIFFVGKKIVNSLKSGSGETVRGIEKEIKVTELTKPESWYLTNADRLYRAMKGAGTTFQTIIDVVSAIASKSDWNKLVQVFGVRSSDNWVYSFKGNLIEWLEDELSPSEFTQIKEILNRKGVQI